jgi:hypothetical protein
MLNQINRWSVLDLFAAALLTALLWPFRRIVSIFSRRPPTQDELLKLEQRAAKKWMDAQV